MNAVYRCVLTKHKNLTELASGGLGGRGERVVRN